MVCQFQGEDYLVGVLSSCVGVKEKHTIYNMFGQRKRKTTSFVSVSSYRDWIESTSTSLTEVQYEYGEFKIFVFTCINILIFFIGKTTLQFVSHFTPSSDVLNRVC